MSRLLVLVVAAAVVGLLGAGAAQAQTRKVTVVTSFTMDVTDPFKKAFEKACPGAIRI